MKVDVQYVETVVILNVHKGIKMPILVDRVTVGNTYYGMHGLERKVTKIDEDTVTFIVMALGSKPPAKFKLLQEYTVKLENFANWAVK